MITRRQVMIGAVVATVTRRGAMASVHLPPNTDL